MTKELLVMPKVPMVARFDSPLWEIRSHDGDVICCTEAEFREYFVEVAESDRAAAWIAIKELTNRLNAIEDAATPCD